MKRKWRGSALAAFGQEDTFVFMRTARGSVTQKYLSLSEASLGWWWLLMGTLSGALIDWE